MNEDNVIGIFGVFNLLLAGGYFVFFIIQILCIVHVFKEGKPIYWVFIIFFFPPVGCIVYVFVEFLPSIKHHPYVRSLGGAKKAGKRRLKQLQEAVEDSDTVQNKVDLADAYLSRDEFSQSTVIYRECLEGVHKDDSVIIYKLSESLFGEEKYQESLELLLQLEKLKYRDYRSDREFQAAICYSYVGNFDKGIELLEKISDSYSGEEAKYRLGVLYLKVEREEDALEVFEKIINNRKKYRKATVGSQRKWVSLARKKLKEIGREN